MSSLLHVVMLASCALAVPVQETSDGELPVVSAFDMSMSTEELFEAFKDDNKKIYVHKQQETMRRQIFADNVDFIRQHNEKYARGEKSYYLGINDMADMTHQEIKDRYTASIKLPSSNKLKGSKMVNHVVNDDVKIPDVVNWREKGYVTGVKKQGACGSCWAFTTTGAIEGQYFKKTGKLRSFSEQQLVDCTYDYGNNGCDGGIMELAYEYLMAAPEGLHDENEYKYIGVEILLCLARNDTEHVKLTSYVQLPSGSELALQVALYHVGPIAVCIDASLKEFHFYKGGIFDEESCDHGINHGVLAIGYGPGYYLVKNSWGRKWGDHGYVKMARNKSNQCNIATHASFPIL